MTTSPGIKKPGAWARVYGALYDHPKVVCLGYRNVEAMALWVLGASYCARRLETDGRISLGVCERLVGVAKASRWAAALVKVGLWDEIQPGEYTFHDYTDWNWSSRDVELYLIQQRAKGSKGGQQSAASRRARAQAVATNGSPAAAQAAAPALAQATAQATAQANFKPPADTDSKPPYPPEAGASHNPPNQPPHPTCLNAPGCSCCTLPLDPSGRTACADPEGSPWFTWPTRDLRAASLQPRHPLHTRWAPGREPYEAFHHNCPEPRWRGRCSVLPAAHAAAPSPKQCPHHRAVVAASTSPEDSPW